MSAYFRTLLLVLLVVSVVGSPVSAAQDAPDAVSPEEAARTLLEAETLQAIDREQPFSDWGAFAWRVDSIRFSGDYAFALIWLARVDETTGENVATEPALAAARYSSAAGALTNTGEWKILFQTAPEFEKFLLDMPDSLTQSAVQEYYLPAQGAPEVAEAAPFGGYRLPWAKGLVKHLSMGAYHTSCLTTCRYAFDFADGTMFPLLAAKGGTVYHYKDTCTNGSETCTNSLTLRDASTTPATYQIYLHLAQGSIPAELKRIGAPVNQGQYIGNVDDTGYSTGHHLHFMVVTNPYLSSQDYIWGYSVDITFRDVSINYDVPTQGGRPCTQIDYQKGYCSEWQYNYTSGNQGTNPPVGSLTGPDNAINVTNGLVTASGWGMDDRGVTRMAVIANDGAGWLEVGESQFTSPFTTTINLCDAGLTDGPVTLSLRVFDVEGNMSIGPQGLRQVNLQSGCSSPPPPPACEPGANQVSLYEKPNYQGACKVLEAGVKYTSGTTQDGEPLWELANNAESIMVGSNAAATLYAKKDYTVRGETFFRSDPDLSDNMIGLNNNASVWVGYRSAAPNIPWPYWPFGDSITEGTSLTLQWDNRGGYPSTTNPHTGGWASEYQAELYRGATLIMTRDWSPELSWSVGSLADGSYTWKVRARNRNGTTGWNSATFTVTDVPPAGGTVVNPQTFDFEAGTGDWVATGLWNLSSTRASGGIYSWWYGQYLDSVEQYSGNGSLTSPPIQIPAAGYILQFDYSFQTESTAPWRDQRYVQIAGADGIYRNVLQLYHDVPASQVDYGDWMTSPAVDLSAYAGQAIRVRFVFETLDATLNLGAGWAVDDVRVTNAYTPPVCSDANEQNNIPAAATAINQGAVVNGQICPAGDVDYYKFTGYAGQPVAIDLDAKTLTPASLLDTEIFLMDSTGMVVLAHNDDEQYGVYTDSRIEATLPESGTYYIKVKAWNHPEVGGTGYTYRLALVADAEKPTVQLMNPVQGGFIGGPTSLTALASDASSGIHRVEFYYHSADWEMGTWLLLGADYNGADGWNWLYDATTLPEGLCDPSGLCRAFYVKAFDKAGNWAGDGSWNIGIDRTAPTSALQTLPASYPSTAVLLQWSGSDALSGLGRFDLQSSPNGSTSWVDAGNFNGGLRQGFYVGTAGQSVYFRLRAVDNAGNAEGYPAAAEAFTTIASVCTNDGFEGDNTRTLAKPISEGAAAQVHTFCQGDEDWVTLTPVAGRLYLWMASPEASLLPLGGGASATLELYDSSGNLLTQVNAAQPGAGTVLWWRAPSAEPVYLRMLPGNAAVWGTGVRMSLWVGEGVRLYLPVVVR